MKDKKSMIMVIIIGITLCLFFCFNTTVFATTGTVTTGELRLRKGSSTSSEILDLLEENQEVEILSEDGDWYKVKVNKQVGYVNKQYVKVKENNNIISNETTSNESKTEEKEENKEENKTETVAEVKVNSEATLNSDSQIRIIPLVSGDVTNTAKENQKFKIVSTLGAWSYIENDEMSGWILTQDLTVSESNTQEPVQEENNEENNNEETVNEEKTEKMYDEEKTYYVSATSVNVRSEASKSADVKDVLTTNDEVSVQGESGEWYIVSVNGSKGYIAKTLLSTTKKEVTSRSSNTVAQDDGDDDEEYEEQSAPAAPAGSATGESIAGYAQQFVGYPYVYGASGPNAFDCSGFAQYIYGQFGIGINRTADAQAYNGYYVSKDELAPGDLVFFGTSGGGISHVGIYIGGDQFVHASTSRTGVKISSLSESYYIQRYVTARRIA